MGSKIEAKYPSIAMPAYNLEKSLDPFNSIARDSRTPAQKIGVCAWKMILRTGQLKNVFRPKIYSTWYITKTQRNQSHAFNGLYNNRLFKYNVHVNATAKRRKRTKAFLQS
jgi:hypothetical protein